jgi:putative NIF3 family GTP cyclohydrolase 1 type 2
MNKYEIVSKIEQFAPIELAQAWDCVGFMAETKNVNINKIMLCLTPTNDVIKQALAQNCDMIISHHPLFFVPLKYSNIDIYCAHTNIDKAEGGTTDTLIKKLGFSKTRTFSESYFVAIINSLLLTF